jgi:hypothetical protein
MPAHATSCRIGPACRAQVLWVTLATGGRMPVDVAADPEGTVAIYRDAAGRWVGRVLKAGEEPLAYEKRHVTHFATCAAKKLQDAHRQAVKALPANVIPLDRARHGRP